MTLLDACLEHSLTSTSFVMKRSVSSSSHLRDIHLLHLISRRDLIFNIVIVVYSPGIASMNNAPARITDTSDKWSCWLLIGRRIYRRYCTCPHNRCQPCSIPSSIGSQRSRVEVVVPMLDCLLICGFPGRRTLTAPRNGVGNSVARGTDF